MSDNSLYKEALKIRLLLDNKTMEQKELYLKKLLKTGNIYFIFDKDRILFKKEMENELKNYYEISDDEKIELESKILSKMNRSLFVIE